MAIVGPWAIAVYGDKVNWGVVPVPTSDGMSADDDHTFSDAKNVGMYSACKNQGTAWDVLKFATSKEQDGTLLDKHRPDAAARRTCRPPTRLLPANPDYKEFADQAARTVEVPNVPNSIEIWQTFRDAYPSRSSSARRAVADALTTAAGKVDDARRSVLRHRP